MYVLMTTQTSFQPQARTYTHPHSCARKATPLQAQAEAEAFGTHEATRSRDCIAIKNRKTPEPSATRTRQTARWISERHVVRSWWGVNEGRAVH